MFKWGFREVCAFFPTATAPKPEHVTIFNHLQLTEIAPQRQCQSFTSMLYPKSSIKVLRSNAPYLDIHSLWSFLQYILPVLAHFGQQGGMMAAIRSPTNKCVIVCVSM